MFIAPYQPIILRVRSNPKPGNFIPLNQTQCAPPDPNPHRIQGLNRMDLAKMQTWMIGIQPPPLIGPPCRILHMVWEFAKADQKVIRKA
jgi:hypothetical protein